MYLLSFPLFFFRFNPRPLAVELSMVFPSGTSKWGGVLFQQASAQKKTNRQVDAGASVYTRGSILVVEHKKIFEALIRQLMQSLPSLPDDTASAFWPDPPSQDLPS
ncbi:hypothetical protein RJT34_32497 [Clitoria ternatea]|uniref:Uncharacterized protein n=1 Tax=Clitoria ternatea TaxID=43366 RepID=A0AAN9EW72_CLITE